MGNRKSRPKPIVYPPLDPMFIPIGCTGMLRKEYDFPRLDLAPFLYYRIKVTSYSQLITRILELMRTLPPMDEEAPPEPARPEDLDVSLKRIHGPVYLFIAFDPEQGFIEAYLYFPSMTKERTKWHSYHFLGLSHSWMYRLIYSPDYNILRPNTNCGRRLRDPRHTPDLDRQRQAKLEELRKWKEFVASGGKAAEPPKVVYVRGRFDRFARPQIQPQAPQMSLEEAPQKIATLEREIAAMDDVVKSMGMEIGCRTEVSYGCVQSKRAHKMMRIYRRRKPIHQYPAAYFRVYQLNLNDPRFTYYVEDSSMPIRRDILPSDVEMFPGCRHMLVSPSRKYFMILSNSWLTIFWNYGNENLEALCRFNRNPAMAMAVRMIPFYGQTETRLVIENGFLNIYSDIFDVETNVYSRQVVPENARSPFAMVLQDDGTLVVYDSKNDVVSSKDGLMTDSEFDVNNQNIDDYDAAEDYRRRIINLIAYLRMYNLYKEIEASQETLPKDVAMYVLQEGIPPYNAQNDYMERLQNLVKFLIARGFTNLIEKAAEKNNTDSGMKSTTASKNTSVPTVTPDMDPETIQPSSDVWQKPSGDIDPNKDADAELCAGLEDEDLANCLENAETEQTNKEAEIEKNAQTGEYALIDSEDPLSAGVSATDPPIPTSSPGVFTNEEYQKALAICRVATADQYMPNQDLYCRVMALKEYLRKRGYTVMDPAAVPATAEEANSFMLDSSITDYNQPVDFATRLQSTRSLFTKTK